MSIAKQLAILIICALLLSYTASKLNKMRQISGSRSGARIYPAIVIDKSQSRSRQSGYYDIRWEADIPERGGRVTGEDRAEYPDWAPLQPGSPIQVALVGKETYYTKSIYAGPGNFAFDYGLLTVEIGGILFALGGLAWRIKKGSGE